MTIKLDTDYSQPIYIDSETCGLHSMMVLLQLAKGEGDIHLYHVWKEPVWKTLELLEWIAKHPVVGFNMTFDWFHVVKIYTIWRLLPRTWIPEDHIEEIAMVEPLGQEGPCIKPATCLDLLLHSRKGPYQSLMAREDVRIRRVPTPLAYPLAEELEKRIELDGIYFAKTADKDAPRWHVYDVKNRDGDIDIHFKDVCLRFNPAGGLKFLAEHALGFEPKFHFKDIEVPKEFRPVEFGYAPTALKVSSPAQQWQAFKKDSKGQKVLKGYAWPGVIQVHIDHWFTHEKAQEYATDDIVYTRALCHHFGDPAFGDDDSILACMVPAIRWRGYRINVPGVEELLKKEQAVMDTSPVNINKPEAVRAYIGECMDEMEMLIIDESTKKAKLTTVSNWKVDLASVAEDDDTGAEGLQGWRINHNEECSKCDGTGQLPSKQCPRCEGHGKLTSGLHPASRRAEEILKIKAAAKGVELYSKLKHAGKFHASFNIIGALSSRMSGGDGLNAQGIKHAKEVRQMFPLAWGEFDINGFKECLAFILEDEFDDVWNRIGDQLADREEYDLSGGDFDSFEVTIAAAIYQDPSLDDIITSGQKVHAHFATCMYPEASYQDVLDSEGTEFDMYTRGKSGFFGILYFGDWTTLVKNFGIPIQDAQAAEQTFLKRHPGVKKARQRIIDDFQGMKQPDGIGTAVVWDEPAECAKTLLGFPRYFTLENQIAKELFDLARKTPKEWSDHKIKVVRRDRVQSAAGAVASALYGAAFQIQAANTRAAGNHEMQGTGAGVTKRLQRRIWDLQPAGVNEFVVAPMNVHDEIMCPLLRRMAGAVTAVVKEVVEGYRDIIPLIGMTWFQRMLTWAGKKGGAVEGEVKVQSPRMGRANGKPETQECAA